jgi:hypothetical protein
MPRKPSRRKSTSRPARPRPTPARPGWQTSIRLTDAQHADYEQAAEFEGFSSIAAWLIEQGRLRSQAIAAAIDSGEWIEIRGRKVPLSDLPPDRRKSRPD